MKSNLFLLVACLLATTINVFSQDKTSAKFGNVKPEDFQKTVYSIDSSAAAVVIADVGSSEFVGNTKSNFSLLFKNYRRAHILNKNGYDIGNVEISLYNSGTGEEELEGLKAVTYNLENGKVVATKLEVKTQVFTDKQSKNWTVKKFTFPNVKEGSIIEYEYKIHSDFIFNLRSWEFQDEYPRLWSEYNVAMPEFYNYVTLSQGYQSPAIRTQKNRQEHYIVSDTRGTGATDRTAFTAGVTDYRWVMKDVPMIREEKYTSTINNHLCRIEFQLASIRDPFIPKQIMSTWEAVARELLEDEDFGLQLRKDNGWLSDVVTPLVKKSANDLEKARNIYNWVRDNFTCTGYNALYLSQTLKTTLKNKNGNVADINLLLTALLIKADLQADPVLLSTRSHGFTHSIYPILDRFNYVVSIVKIGESDYLLDATRPHMAFGKLDDECYNGHARIINRDATPMDLKAELLNETSITSVFIINDENGHSIGSYQKSPGFYESYGLRNWIKGKGKDELEKSIKKEFVADISLSKLRVDSLEKIEEPLTIAYDFELDSTQLDIIYLNPMFTEGYKENPFKSAQRFYPVEMPYKVDEIFTLQIEVPKGYVVEEIPKSVVVKANEAGDASFEYRLSESGGYIHLRSRLNVKRTWFSPEEYETLREFYSLVVKKHNEQIVFKKKK